MKKLVRILTFVLVAMMLLGIAVGCDPNEGGGGDGNTITIKVWAPAEDEFLIGMYEDGFKAVAEEKFPGYNVKVNYTTVAEPDAGDMVIGDAVTAADVFIFPDDQIIKLATAQVLREVTPALGKEDITSRNSESSINAATVGGKLLAYPMTADNTYFLIYDKRVVTNVEKMDDILAQCLAGGKKLFMDVSNGWYINSFFFGTGGNLSLNADGVSMDCDWNNANGLKAAKGIKQIVEHAAFTTGDDTVIKNNTDELAAIVTGAWNIKQIESKWGKANVGLAKLPTFTAFEANETPFQAQMISFGGHKLVGVNALTSVGNVASAFADYMTSEEGQMMRFGERQNVPTNKVVAAKDEVRDNATAKVILDQFQYSRPQSEVLGVYWGPADSFGATLESKDLGGQTLQQLLDTMVAAITAKPL